MEYNINFQDNIMAFAFNDRAQGILNWIKENRQKEEWAKATQSLVFLHHVKSPRLQTAAC
mgnify:CR=1 FL=1